MKIIPDTEAMRYVLQHSDTYCCYLGAGASVEAGVKTAFQICDEIRAGLQQNPASNAKTKQLNKNLHWDDLELRYATCIQKYGKLAHQLQYFRQLLRGRLPSFSHHAVAMLAAGGYFRKTIVTTNFDKLIENAFARQGRMECQAIRTKDELAYWAQEKDKAYVLKLHGDYDTYNIANTLAQTVLIIDKMEDALTGLLKGGGMLVLGAAGHEKSVYTLFDRLSAKTGESEHVLDFGLLWGVYMGSQRPAEFDEKEIARRITQNVGKNIVQLMDRMQDKNQMFRFFPFWGTGNFFLELIKDSEDQPLIARAQSYLDHEMRLRQVFSTAGLKPKAVEEHLDRLREQREEVDRAKVPSLEAEVVYRARKQRSPLTVQIIYGDITCRALLSKPELEGRRAVVSPEDTWISAGGGVAYRLLRETGEYMILNELAKLQRPIEHGAVATTSGGDLPVEYIFHAAALKIDENAKYAARKRNVVSAVRSVLSLSQALQVRVLWIPLIGAGLARLLPEVSLRSILECLREWRPEKPSIVNIVILQDAVLSRTIATRHAHKVLGKMFSANLIVNP